jgi:hypothetical protein
MRLSRGVLTLFTAGVLGIATAVAASAQDPKPGQTFTDKGFTSTMPAPGYNHPPASYVKGQAFSVAFNVHNDSSASKTACFTFQVFRLPDFDAGTDRTEAFLEANLTENQVVVFDSGPQNLTFAGGETRAFTRGATLTAEGYYQFDFGFCSDVPLVPKAGFNGPLISGFVRMVAPVVVATPTPTPTPTPTGGGVLGTGGSATPSPRALTLATTGYGAQPQGEVSWLVVLLSLGLLAAAGLGLLLRRDRQR